MKTLYDETVQVKPYIDQDKDLSELPGYVKCECCGGSIYTGDDMYIARFSGSGLKQVFCSLCANSYSKQ